jgi:hypothetical protein
MHLQFLDLLIATTRGSIATFLFTGNGYQITFKVVLYTLKDPKVFAVRVAAAGGITLFCAYQVQ